jgi:hypothetical protein
VQQAALVGVVEGLGDRRAEDEPAGLSAKDLDDYSTRLGAELSSRAS